MSNISLNVHEALKKLTRFVTTDRNAIGQQTLTLSTANATTLTVPDNAKYAILQVEQTGGSGSSKVIRYWLHGENPTTTTGIARGDMDVFDIVGRANLLSCKLIRVTAANHVVQIQYYT